MVVVVMVNAHLLFMLMLTLTLDVRVARSSEIQGTYMDIFVGSRAKRTVALRSWMRESKKRRRERGVTRYGLDKGRDGGWIDPVGGYGEVEGILWVTVCVRLV